MNLPSTDVSGFPAEQVLFAAAAWPLRAAEEARSEAVFREIGRVAVAERVDPVFQARIDQAADDERFHAELCVEVGAELGAPSPRYDATPVERRLAALPSGLPRLLALLTVEVAVGETLSCALFKEGMQRAKEPLTRAALSAILRDEAKHAQLGWNLIEALAPRLDGRDRAFLQEEVRLQLGALEQVHAVPALRSLEQGLDFDSALESLGVLHPEVRVAAFYEALERRVLPRLEALGLEGHGGWQRRYARP
jgi:hypothetical protein